THLPHRREIVVPPAVHQSRRTALSCSSSQLESSRVLDPSPTLTELQPSVAVVPSSVYCAAQSTSSTVNTGQTDVGVSRTENIPVQVTTIRLTKENYLQWSAAITMGIAGRGRIAYVNGRKTEPVETNFYAALKTKWEELDYYSDDTWNCPQDQSHRSWRRAFFVDRSSWKLPSLNAVEVPASVFRLQPIRAAALLLGTPPPRDPCRRLRFRACRCLGIRAAASGFAPLVFSAPLPRSHRSWRRAFFVDRSSWKLPSLNAVEVSASVFRLQPIRAAVLLLGTPSPRDPCRLLGFCAHCRLGNHAIVSGFALLPRVSCHDLGIRARRCLRIHAIVLGSVPRDSCLCLGFCDIALGFVPLCCCRHHHRCPLCR
ncbi:hypothetical protein EJ110_NYTH59407, partial [Nymphaea thermarum]